MTMLNLEDSQNEWKIKKVLDHQWIKNTVHYLIKWATWSSEYNSYKSAAHLAKTSEAVATFEQKLKHKQNESEDTVSDKQACHMSWFWFLI